MEMPPTQNRIWELAFTRPGSEAGRKASEGGDPQRSGAGKEEAGGIPPSPRAPRAPRAPSSSASRRRKCCVAHFRVLSDRCCRASVVSWPPPPPLPPPRILEPGATSPPWPASKVGLGCWAPED